MRLVDRFSKRRTAIAIVAIVLSTIASSVLSSFWHGASGTGFGTADWQKNIFKAQKARELGDLNEANVYYKRAYADAQKLGKQHPFYTVTLRHLSDAAYEDFNYPLAKDYALKELELLKPLGDDYQDLVPIFIRLGDIAFAQGNLEETKVQLLKAKTLKDKAQFDPTLKAEIRLRLANLALANKDQSQFHVLCQEAENEWLSTVKEPKTGSNFSEYAVAIARLSRHTNKRVSRALREAALYYGTVGARMITKTQGKETLHYIHAMSRLGEIHGICKQPAQKIACYQRGSEAAIASRVLNFQDKAVVLFQYGKPLMDEGHLEEALPMLRQSAIYARTMRNRKFDRSNILANLSNCLVRLNQIEEAIVVKQEMVGVLETMGMKREAQAQLREIDVLSARIK